MNIAAVESSYEAWAETINPSAGHIVEINGIDSPKPAETRSEILQAIENATFSARFRTTAVNASQHESRCSPAFPVRSFCARSGHQKTRRDTRPDGSKLTER